VISFAIQLLVFRVGTLVEAQYVSEHYEGEKNILAP
jgi:hypothetical protein